VARSPDWAAASNAAPASDGDAKVLGVDGAAFSVEEVFLSDGGLTAWLQEISEISSAKITIL
jgi:hypothetical protein